MYWIKENPNIIVINTNNIVIQYGSVILTCLPFWSAQDPHTPSRQLRSSAGSRILCIPSVNTKSYSERYFCYSAQRCRTPFQKKSATLSQPLPLNQHLRRTFSQHDTDWCVCVCVRQCVRVRCVYVWQWWECYICLTQCRVCVFCHCKCCLGVYCPKTKGANWLA